MKLSALLEKKEDSIETIKQKMLEHQLRAMKTLMEECISSESKESRIAAFFLLGVNYEVLGEGMDAMAVATSEHDIDALGRIETAFTQAYS